MIFFLKTGVFFYLRSKFTEKCNFFVFEIFVVIYNRYYRAIKKIRALKRSIMELPTSNRKKIIDI